MKKFFYSFLFLTIFICFSCSPKNDYVVWQNMDIKNHQWIYPETLSFDFEMNDTTNSYLLGFCLRYTNEFPDANLYLFVYTTFPDKNQTCDTVSIDLFYPDGTPTGKGKHVKELNVAITNVKFPQKGNYTFSLQQANRHDTLSGMVSAGIFLTSSK